MALESFTRLMVISNPSVIERIHTTLKANSADEFRSSIRNINELKPENREALAKKITSKY